MGPCGPDHWVLWVTGVCRPNPRVTVQCTMGLCGTDPGTLCTRIQQPVESPSGSGKGENTEKPWVYLNHWITFES